MIQHPTSVVRSLTGLQTPNDGNCAFDWADSELATKKQVKTTDTIGAKRLVRHFIM
jgi:hypothetical protein